MKIRPIGFLALILTAIMVMAIAAQAHDRTSSYSQWRVSHGGADVVLTMSDVDLTGLSLPSADAAGSELASSQYATQRLVMFAGDQPCRVSERPQRLDAPAGRTRLAWHVVCPDKGTLLLQSDLFVDTYPGHLHFASIRGDRSSAERVLTRKERSWKLEEVAPASGAGASSTSIGEFWALGVEHISTGYDHLTFLLALVLLGGTFMSLVKIVSGFTVGHSVTLALATLGLVQPEIGSVESLIALSIMLVAIENVWLLGRRSYFLPAVMVMLLVLLSLWSLSGRGVTSGLSYLGLGVFVACYYPLLRENPRVESARWVVALIFGLIHGFAFASVLRAANMTPAHLPGALLGFNLGVESGQIVIVAVAWPLIRKALSYWGTIVIEAGSAVTFGLGIFWLTIRVLK